MSELKTSNQEELGDIPITECLSHSAEQHLQYLEEDVHGHFNKIERGAGALIVGAATNLIPKPGVPQVGRLLQTRELSRVAVRTVHKDRQGRA